ncbi:hypothetical protein L798_13167 [Zootermopsis nevadensis]|uniref:Uncharacterized protein n=1 Tax=Zootermopsis nevadensis TaxID=136037 RepID=A0A067R239_ZOONE|nr:hypothetical protein L798_13167 [Zootermopsis nevadensis]
MRSRNSRRFSAPATGPYPKPEDEMGDARNQDGREEKCIQDSDEHN